MHQILFVQGLNVIFHLVIQEKKKKKPRYVNLLIILPKLYGKIPQKNMEGNMLL